MKGVGCCLIFSTTPHIKGAEYVINLENIRDCAKQPNYLGNPEWRYKFELKFTDHFEMNSCGQYSWFHEEKEGGFGQQEYDAKNKRMKVLTGDNVSEKFSRMVPLLSKGRFSISFLPFAKYPNGGAITIKLKADERNYYELSNTDGYGPGKIEKYIDGQIVDSASFSNQYSQKIPYEISIDFSSSLTKVEAFDQVMILKKDNQKIRVKEFEIKLAQQDAFFDDIKYIDESAD